MGFPMEELQGDDEGGRLDKQEHTAVLLEKGHANSDVARNMGVNEGTARIFCKRMRREVVEGRSLQKGVAWRGAGFSGATSLWKEHSPFDRFLDEAERVGVLVQRREFRTIETGWNFGIDLEFQGHFAARRVVSCSMMSSTIW